MYARSSRDAAKEGQESAWKDRPSAAACGARLGDPDPGGGPGGPDLPIPDASTAAGRPRQREDVQPERVYAWVLHPRRHRAAGEPGGDPPAPEPASHARL